MKKLDRYIQLCRFRKVVPYIKNDVSILDIGCNKGEFFGYLSKKSIRFKGTGLDPHINETSFFSNYMLIKDVFPSIHLKEKTFDQIVCMAVFEHIPAAVLNSFIDGIYASLKENGELIMTVPSAKVDFILHVLRKVGLVNGMDLHEHHGFDASLTTTYFDSRFELVKYKKFQLGLNNLFVFHKC